MDLVYQHQSQLNYTHVLDPASQSFVLCERVHREVSLLCKHLVRHLALLDIKQAIHLVHYFLFTGLDFLPCVFNEAECKVHLQWTQGQ